MLRVSAPYMLGAWLLAFGSPAFGQAMGGQWVGDKYLVCLSQGFPPGKALVDGDNNIIEIIPDMAKAGITDAPFPKMNLHYGSYVTYRWHGGTMYGLVKGDDTENGDGSQSLRWMLAKWQDGEWHFLASCATGAEEELKIIPCDNGRFIAISLEKDLVDDGRRDRSPFARMSIHEGSKELRLGASIDHGQDWLRGHMSDPAFFGLAWMSTVVMTDKHATIIDCNNGLYWAFSLEKASLVRAGGIFRKVTPEMIAKGDLLYRTVLCANPEKGGTVLISAQEEDFVIAASDSASKAMNEINELRDNNPLITDLDHSELLGRRYKELADSSPFIVWYRLYPENGKLEKLAAPPEGGAALRDGGENDVWWLLPDGSVRMGFGDECGVNDKSRQEPKSESHAPQADKQGNGQSEAVSGRVARHGQTIWSRLSDSGSNAPISVYAR